MKKYYSIFTLILFFSVSLFSCQDDKEEEDVDFARQELKDNMMRRSWDWNNYNEHAVYTFKADGTVSIAFDTNTGGVDVSVHNWDTIDGQSFYITDSMTDPDREVYNKVTITGGVGSSNNYSPFTMKGEICDGPNDCNFETWVGI